MSLITKILLFPFAALYGAIIWLRNWLYKTGFIGSTDFALPVISVGNLSMGGTGKTPMIGYLIELLYPDYAVGVLSRGYGRKTSGYLSVQTGHTALQVGDEPLMTKLKYPFVQVSVGEQRVIAIPRLLSDHPETRVILLDDAFQHQSVRPDINILLTSYRRPFYDDRILPLGTLREFISGKDRAQIIVMTKCPPDLSEPEQQAIVQRIAPAGSQQIFFSTIEYGTPYNVMDPQEKWWLNTEDTVMLVTAIADAGPLKEQVEKQAGAVYHMEFSDHHMFEEGELNSIYTKYPGQRKWLTTEKDAVRLMLHKEWLIQKGITVFCVPVRTRFIGRDAAHFSKTVKGFVDYFYSPEERGQPGETPAPADNA